MIPQLKQAIDEFLDHDPQPAKGPAQYSFPVRRRKFSYTVKDDIYEAAKAVIRDVEMKWHLCIGATDYEAAIWYICQKMRY